MPPYQRRTKQRRTKQRRTKQRRTKQRRTKQRKRRTKQRKRRTKQRRTKQRRTKQRRTKQRRTKQRRTKQRKRRTKQRRTKGKMEVIDDPSKSGIEELKSEIYSYKQMITEKHYKDKNQKKNWLDKIKHLESLLPKTDERGLTNLNQQFQEENSKKFNKRQDLSAFIKMTNPSISKRKN
jgi:hypothetical protein